MSNKWLGRDVELSREFVALLKERSRGLSSTEFARFYVMKRKTLDSWASAFKAGKTAHVKSGLLRHLLAVMHLQPDANELCLPRETVEVLKATLAGDPIAPDTPQKDAYFIRSNVQVLDLRTQLRAGQTNAAHRNSVILLDQFEIEAFEGKPRTFSFQHATTGTQINGECLSHPANSRSEVEELTSNTAGWRKRCRMSVDHAALEAGGHDSIVARFEFIDGFNGVEKEWFESGINYAQGSLTIILLFSPERPCKDVTTSARQLAGQYRREGNVGELFKANTLVHWHVKNPELGMTYHIEWEW